MPGFISGKLSCAENLKITTEKKNEISRSKARVSVLTPKPN